MRRMPRALSSGVTGACAPPMCAAHVGGDVARMQDCDPDPPGKFEREGAGRHVERGLRAAVGVAAHAGSLRDGAELACDEGDGAPFACGDMLGEGGREHHRRNRVDAQAIHPLVRVQRPGERAGVERIHAGIVPEHVDALVPPALGECGDGAVVGHIEAGRFGDAVEAGQRRRVAADGQHPPAVGQILACKGAADAARSAGNQGRGHCAVTSISIFMAGSTRPATTTAVAAGRISPKTSPNTGMSAGKSAASVR